MLNKVEFWLAENDYGHIVRQEPVDGGCINNASRLHLDKGRTLFLKYSDKAPDNMFLTEVEGLEALRQADALRIPKVIHAEEDFLILEDLGQGEPVQDYWEQLGKGLAKIHETQGQQYGFFTDNYCGSTRQVNDLTFNGFEFFAAYRILTLATAAAQRGLLEADDVIALDSIAMNLSSWIPIQAAVLIHGDLWSGNVHCDQFGQPALIDPAPYWGWAEAELAMTKLFGGFPDRFYDSYAEHGDLESDWLERAPLYNLYHLLNHLLLFGESYLPQIRSITDRFAS